MNIGKKLKYLRTSNNFTLKTLSEKTGLSVSFISDIENGRRNPNIDNLTKLASALHTTADKMLSAKTVARETAPQYGQPKDLAKFLEQTEVMFDGEVYKLDDEDKAKLRAALEFGFWTAKEKNKRKKK